MTPSRASVPGGWTRAEAVLRNRLVALCGPHRLWQSWAAEAFAGLGQVRTGYRVRLRATHLLPGQRPDVEGSAEGRARIGRNPDNDLVLTEFTVGGRHAHVTPIDGRSCRVDFNGNRDGKPLILTNGAEFGIMPWKIRAWVEPIFEQRFDAELAPATLSAGDWNSWKDAPGFVQLPIEVHPCGRTAFLSVESDFVSSVASRINGDEPARFNAVRPCDEGNAANRGVVEYMLLRLLERANRDLRFPFRLALPGTFPPPVGSSPGLMARFSVRTGDLSGAVRLFVPSDLVTEIEWQAPRESAPSPAIAWPVRACIAVADLEPGILAQIVPGALLRIRYAPALYLSASFAEGWSAAAEGEYPLSFRVQGYFNRRIEMDEKTGAAQPDPLRLEQLPVRLHAVLCEREMTYADLKDLRPGSLVELHAKEDDAATIYLNGRPAGTGRLVTIDGERALEILDWRVV